PSARSSSARRSSSPVWVRAWIGKESVIGWAAEWVQVRGLGARTGKYTHRPLARFERTPDRGFVARHDRPGPAGRTTRTRYRWQHPRSIRLLERAGRACPRGEAHTE